jgi:hypothetical protein
LKSRGFAAFAKKEAGKEGEAPKARLGNTGCKGKGRSMPAKAKGLKLGQQKICSQSLAIYFFYPSLQIRCRLDAF